VTNENGESFPDFDGLSERWDTAGEYLAVYPNVLMGTHRDQAFVILLIPEAPDRTVEQVHLYYARPDTDCGLRLRNTQLWKTVFEEDIFVVEGMQRGRHAAGFDGGRFSPAMDGPTHCFHDWVAGRMMAHRAMGRAAE
jgi:phenylpropionate dioxygenase-like ring-hydroxylating dioxygenase large terminal subunit